MLLREYLPQLIAQLFFLLQLLKCINHLSTDPNCLENLQRAEAIKHLIPNLELKEGPLISQIYHEVGTRISLSFLQTSTTLKSFFCKLVFVSPGWDGTLDLSKISGTLVGKDVVIYGFLVRFPFLSYIIVIISEKI